MYKKQGYLREEFKIFKLKDRVSKDFPFHYHDFYKIIVFMGGNVIYNIEGKNYELKAGDIVVVSANEIHRPVIDSEVLYDRIVVYLSQSFLNEDKRLSEVFSEAKLKHTNVLRLSQGDYQNLVDLLEKAIKKEKEDDYAGSLYSRLYLTESLLCINESVHKNGLLFDGNVSYDRKIVDICEYINNHLQEDLSVDSLSEKFLISKYYFMRKFKEYTGVTVHNYILEKRVLNIKSLTDSGEKVTKACIRSGFKDYSTYLRAKKRLSSRLIESYDRE